MTIRIANYDDIPSIEKLRIIAYQNATGSVTPDTSFLNWGTQDEQSIVLILENEQKQIVSTMRGNLINTLTELEAFFDITLNASFSFPVFTMGRAATFLEYRGLGYSAAMRILFLKACLSNHTVQGIASTIQADASRVLLLQQMGYHIEKADISNRQDSYFHNSSDTLFNLLPRKCFESAIMTATQKIVTPLSAFEIQSNLVAQIHRRIDQLSLTHHSF